MLRACSVICHILDNIGCTWNISYQEALHRTCLGDWTDNMFLIKLGMFDNTATYLWRGNIFFEQTIYRWIGRYRKGYIPSSCSHQQMFPWRTWRRPHSPCCCWRSWRTPSSELPLMWFRREPAQIHTSFYYFLYNLVYEDSNVRHPTAQFMEA